MPIRTKEEKRLDPPQAEKTHRGTAELSFSVMGYTLGNGSFFLQLVGLCFGLLAMP